MACFYLDHVFKPLISIHFQTTPVEIADCSQVPGHLGYIAAVTGRKLKWNTAKQEIVGDAEAQAMTQPIMRGPWKI